MKKLIKILAIVLALSLSVSLFACGGGNKEGDGNVVVQDGVTYTKVADGTYSVTKFEKSTTIVEIPEQVNGIDVTSIGNQVFNYKKLITKVTLPKTVVKLGEYAFTNCEKLSTINLENVKVFGNNSFAGCKELRPIDISSATTLGNSVFQDCIKLLKVVVPETVKVIPKNAFANCRLLNTVEFKGIIDEVGQGAFSACSSLKTVNLSNLKRLCENAFSACSNLTEVVLTNVTEIQNMVFQSCSKLASVTIGANCIYLNKNAFNKCTNIATFTLENVQGWYDVGTCARCAITEWAGMTNASNWTDPVANVSKIVAGDWTHNQYMCKEAWKAENRPNGWNVNKTDVECSACHYGGK